MSRERHALGAPRIAASAATRRSLRPERLRAARRPRSSRRARRLPRGKPSPSIRTSDRAGYPRRAQRLRMSEQACPPHPYRAFAGTCAGRSTFPRITEPALRHDPPRSQRREKQASASLHESPGSPAPGTREQARFPAPALRFAERRAAPRTSFPPHRESHCAGTRAEHSAVAHSPRAVRGEKCSGARRHDRRTVAGARAQPGVDAGATARTHRATRPRPGRRASPFIFCFFH